MNHFSLSRAVIGTVLVIAAMAPLSAHADISRSKVCPKLSPEVSIPRGVEVPEVCYSGFNCTVGMRGDWLDITNRVGFYPADRRLPTATQSIAERGTKVRATNTCVPASYKDREGYVAILLEEIKGTGWASAEAARNALPSQPYFDVVRVEVRDGTHFLNPVQRTTLTARVGVVKTIEITGRGLRDLRVRAEQMNQLPVTKTKPAAIGHVRDILNQRPKPELPAATPTVPAVSIVSQSYDKATLKVNFDTAGTLSLADYLEFSVGDPAINRDLGWPEVQVGQ